MSLRRVFAVLATLIVAQPLFMPPTYGGERESVTTVFEHDLPNAPGKKLVALVVNYGPGGKSDAHTHAKSAFIYARVLSGEIKSKVNDEDEKVYKVGEQFFELPGSSHKVSENASETDPASLLAVFIVEKEDEPLTSLEK
ncbi:cupin domain-containing protein [Pararhizobium sp. BT-229]|uniref:cupin domain-containing protein n=1 Tax=Pararhizobium sp. BT-229 TaxID=2986923 RepID=UPI0021F75A76|nr:cupin domain-containing protein [Pararhizobium sp. BT-229]MCV9960296.1 cupin domain-containing protein [Pararhizobium sp. BT-229]